MTFNSLFNKILVPISNPSNDIVLGQSLCPRFLRIKL